MIIFLLIFGIFIELCDSTFVSRLSHSQLYVHSSVIQSENIYILIILVLFFHRQMKMTLMSLQVKNND